MGKITRIAGSLVEADGTKGSKIYELVKVGDEKLLGEIIRLKKDGAVSSTRSLWTAILTLMRTRMTFWI